MMIIKNSARGITNVSSHIFGKATVQCLAPLVAFMMTCVFLPISQDIKERFESYRRAYNQHDTKAVLSFLAPDYEFKVANSTYKVAKKDIAGLLEWDFATNVHSTYSNVQVKGNTISAVLTEQNDFYKSIGISERKYRFTYVYSEAGLIKEAILEQALSDKASFDAAFKPALDWARKERPQELSEIYPDSKFVYNTQMAKRWLALLQDWRKATRMK
jgi:ketosteroid isomerase-like protein